MATPSANVVSEKLNGTRKPVEFIRFVAKSLEGRLPEVLQLLGAPADMANGKQWKVGDRKYRIVDPIEGGGVVDPEGKGFGDTVSFVANVKDWKPGEAARWLADQLGIREGEGSVVDGDAGKRSSKPANGQVPASPVADEPSLWSWDQFHANKILTETTLEQVKAYAKARSVQWKTLLRLRCFPESKRFKFPERDPSIAGDSVVGFHGRFWPKIFGGDYRIGDDGKPRRSHQEGKRGFQYINDWDKCDRPMLLIVEGHADVASAIDAGFMAIGRCSRDAKLDRLQHMLRSLRDDVVICITLERDRPKPNCKTPREEVEKRAKELSELIGRPVYVVRPPDPHKDLNDWWRELTAGQGSELDEPSRHRLGDVMHEHFLAQTANGIDEAGSDIDQVPQPEAQAAKDDFEGITNFTKVVRLVDGKEKEVEEPLHILQICSDIFRQMKDQPIRVGPMLVAISQDGEPRRLKDATDLFSWIKESCEVRWKTGQDRVSKDEIFRTIEHRARQFDRVERYPHFPRIPNVYYLCEDPKPGDGKTLERFLDFFSFSDDSIDRELFLAAVVTPFWGGEPGERPTFLFESKAGQGGGKTTAANCIASLSGGTIEFDHHADADSIIKRLLNGDTSPRIILFDNIKTSKLSSSAIESLVTKKSISGSVLYSGNGQTPNLWTMFLTFNDAQMSTDMARRCVSIMLGSPSRSYEWYRNVQQFISENRSRIIEDVAAFFAREPHKGSVVGTFASWEGDILARLNNSQKVALAYIKRAEEKDDDRATAVAINEETKRTLRWLGYPDPDDNMENHYRVLIPSRQLQAIVSKACGEDKDQREATKLVGRLSPRLLEKFEVNTTMRLGRGFWFQPSDDGFKDEYLDFGNRFRSKQEASDLDRLKRNEAAKMEVQAEQSAKLRAGDGGYA